MEKVYDRIGLTCITLLMLQNQDTGKNKNEGKQWLNTNQLSAISYNLSGKISRLLNVNGLFPISCHLTAAGFLMSTTKIISEAESQMNLTSLKRKLFSIEEGEGAA